MTMQKQRCKPAVTITDTDQMVIYGGLNEGAFVHSVEIFDVSIGQALQQIDFQLQIEIEP